MFRGDRLRTLRLEHQYTHQQFAERMGIAIRMVARYENADANPTSEVIIRMADLFQVSTDYLLGRTNLPHPEYAAGELSPFEGAVVAALRRDDRLAAITIIACKPDNDT